SPAAGQRVRPAPRGRTADPRAARGPRRDRPFGPRTPPVRRPPGRRRTAQRLRAHRTARPPAAPLPRPPPTRYRTPAASPGRSPPPSPIRTCARPLTGSVDQRADGTDPLAAPGAIGRRRPGNAFDRSVSRAVPGAAAAPEGARAPAAG